MNKPLFAKTAATETPAEKAGHVAAIAENLDRFKGVFLSDADKDHAYAEVASNAAFAAYKGSGSPAYKTPAQYAARTEAAIEAGAVKVSYEDGIYSFTK